MAGHRYMQWIVALTVSMGLALWAYQRATDPEPTRQKAIQEDVVAESRLILSSYVVPGGALHHVDPLSPDHKIGKSYIWPANKGWEVSGFYRRNELDVWHPFLMKLDGSSELVSLAVKDGNDRLIGMSARDERFYAVP